MAGCAGVHSHVEVNWLGVDMGREKREAHAGWRDGKGCRGSRRMLFSRVVCFKHGGRGRGGNHLARVGPPMIFVVVVAVVVVPSVVVAVVVVASVVVADVVVSTVPLSALVTVAPVVVVALSLSTVTSLLVATVAVAVVLLLLMTVNIVVSRRFVESAPVAVPAAGSVSRRFLVVF